MSSYLEMNNNAPMAAKKVWQKSPVVKEYPVLTKHDLKLSEKGLSPEEQELAWKKVHDYLFAYRSTFIGFQVDLTFDCTHRLKDYLAIHINNVGDPFAKGNLNLNTKAMECAVLDWFANVWNIPLPESVQEKDYYDAYWGYVVSMGCTEANICALYNARDYLSGKPLLRSDTDNANSTINDHADTNHNQADRGNPNEFTPVIFFSEERYYGFVKTSQMLMISTFHDVGSGRFSCPLTYPDDYPSSYSKDFLDQNGWPYLVPTTLDGEMYLPALVKLVDAFASRGYPPMVMFTCGTTFKGHYENPQAAINQLVPILKKHNLYERRVHYSAEDPSKFDIRHGFWFHVDGALGAAHLPFLEMAINEGLIESPFPDGFPLFDFRIPEMMSLSVSPYKWLGCISPTGVFMIRKRSQVKPPTSPLFIGGGDSTISGSRNGHAIMSIWDLLSKKSYRDFTERAVGCEKMAAFTLKKLQELEKELGKDLWASRSPGAIFIYFKQPRDDIVRRYSLKSKSILVKNKQGGLTRRIYSHVCVMSHVDEKMIGTLMAELKEPDAFPDQDSE